MPHISIPNIIDIYQSKQGKLLLRRVNISSGISTKPYKNATILHY